MTLRSAFRSAVEEVRGYWQGPFSLNNPNTPLSAFWGGSPTTSGVSVSEETSLRYSAVWSAVSQISQTMGSLPLGLYKKLKPTGREEMNDHPVHRVLQYPNPETSSMVFRETLQGHLLLWGNAYAEIVWNGAGQPAQLWQLHPSRVTPFREELGGGRYGVIRYRVDGEKIIKAEDMLHITGFSGNGTVGYSVIGQARQNLGLGMAAEQFGASFFGNGSLFGGILTHPGKLNKETKQGIRESILKNHQGPDKANDFIILGEGMTYNRIGIPPNEAQFIETRKFSIADVARWFNMPPHMLKDLERATFSNIEHQSIEFGTHTIRPWCVRWEKELERKLIADSESNIQYVRHTMDALLRGDVQSRYTAYGIGRDKGWLSADEIREKEEMNPQANGQGKLYLVQSAQVPVNLLADLTQSQIDKNKQPPQAPQPPPNNTNPARSEEIEALRAEITALKESASEHRTAVDTLFESVRGLHTVPNELREQVTAHLDTIKAQEQEIATKQSLILLLTERSEQAEQERDVQSVQRIEAVSRAELAEAQATAAEADLLAERTQAAALREAVKAAEDERVRVEQERDERDAQRAEAVTRAEAAEQKAAETAAALTDAEAKVTAARAEVVAAGEQLANRDATIEQSKVDFTVFQDAIKKAEAELVEFGKVRTAAETARADAERAQAEALTAAEELKVADQIVAEATRARLSAEEASAIALETAKAAEAAAEQARKEAADARAETDTAERAISAAEAAAALAVTQAQAEVDAIRTTADATVAAQHKTQADRLARMVTVHRELIVDIMGRMVDLEINGARRNQLTPAKLRSWAASFYLLHLDRCVDALRPAIRIHLAWVGSDDDVDSVALRWLRPQLTAAAQEIGVIADGDPEDYAKTLDRVLTRWERERPSAIADVLLKEEVDHVRSL
jgi:HK97 family phage portal protein